MVLSDAGFVRNPRFRPDRLHDPVGRRSATSSVDVDLADVARRVLFAASVLTETLGRSTDVLDGCVGVWTSGLVDVWWTSGGRLMSDSGRRAVPRSRSPRSRSSARSMFSRRVLPPCDAGPVP
jgi:hypothetical protein